VIAARLGADRLTRWTRRALVRCWLARAGAPARASDKKNSHRARSNSDQLKSQGGSFKRDLARYVPIGAEGGFKARRTELSSAMCHRGVMGGTGSPLERFEAEFDHGTAYCDIVFSPLALSAPARGSAVEPRRAFQPGNRGFDTRYIERSLCSGDQLPGNVC
jgi:hypothetical protein